MFTWICPQCGAEVPPSYAECPNCKPVAAAPPPPPPLPQVAVARPAPTPTRAMPTPTAPPAYAPPPPQPYIPAPSQPVAEPPVQYVYVKQPGLPGWLVTLGVFAVLTAAGYAFYSLVLNRNGAPASASSSAEPATPTEDAGAAKAPRRQRDMSKYLEAAGIRILEENKRPAIKLMLINHSNVDMASLAGTILLTADGKGELASIPFNLASLGAYESKDISAPLKTKLRAYELPDWQFIKAQVKLNAGSE